MSRTTRNYAYHKCCENNCDYCLRNKLHQANVELDRILDQLDYYEEYKDKLTDKKEEN